MTEPHWKFDGVRAQKLWAGTMLVQASARTGPHHHGDLETILYVVRGREEGSV